jgi:hypothetical protein
MLDGAGARSYSVLPTFRIQLLPLASLSLIAREDGVSQHVSLKLDKKYQNTRGRIPEDKS